MAEKSDFGMTESELAKIESAYVYGTGHPLRDALANAQSAVGILESIVRGEMSADHRIDSVAWRMADALYVLADWIEKKYPGSPSPGIHEPTGRGAKLMRPLVRKRKTI